VQWCQPVLGIDIQQRSHKLSRHAPRASKRTEKQHMHAQLEGSPPKRHQPATLP
jgi:hypothetical protein